MKKIFFFMSLVTMMMLTSCKDDEVMRLDLEYDLVVPETVLDIAEAYVTYEEYGQVITEKVRDGRFHKAFSYKWEDDQIETNELGFHKLSLYFKLKVPVSELKEGYKLFGDKKASILPAFSYSYTRDKSNGWTGNSTSSSSSGGDHTTYLLSNSIINHEYTVQEMIDYFDGQDINPFFTAEYSHTRTRISRDLNFEVGFDD